MGVLRPEYSQKDVAEVPDDDPRLPSMCRSILEPYASVTPVQFPGDDYGHLAVPERHAERLAVVVHPRPPDA
jgi:hypothetical protein